MSQQPERIHKKFHIDRTLMLLLLAMTCVSLLAIYCADPIMATRLQGTHLWLKQGMWYAIGFLMLAFLTRFGSDRLFTGVKIFYWILMVLLAILLVDKYVINLPDRFIRPVNGTTAWYQIPGLGTFQPSEFMKVVLIIMVANIIHEHNLGKTEMSFASDFKLFWKVGKIAVPPLILIFLEPDTGHPADHHRQYLGHAGGLGRPQGMGLAGRGLPGHRLRRTDLHVQVLSESFILDLRRGV